MALLDRLIGPPCADCGRRSREGRLGAVRCNSCYARQAEVEAERQRHAAEAEEAARQHAEWQRQIAREEEERRAAAEAEVLARPTIETLAPVIERFLTKLAAWRYDESTRPDPLTLELDAGQGPEPVPTLMHLLEQAPECFTAGHLQALVTHSDVWSAQTLAQAGGGVVSYDSITRIQKRSLEPLRARARLAFEAVYPEQAAEFDRLARLSQIVASWKSPPGPSGT